MHANPQQIPITKKAAVAYADVLLQLQPLIDQDNRYAKTFCKTLSEEGQKWLQTLNNALIKPVDQDVIISLFIAIKGFFNLPFPEKRGAHTIEIALQRASLSLILSEDHSSALNTLLNTLDQRYFPQFEALMLLAQLGENTLTPIFSGNDSVGVVMRKRLRPLTLPLLEKSNILMS